MAKLGGDEYPVAAICERFAKERFIGTANALPLCRIEVPSLGRVELWVERIIKEAAQVHGDVGRSAGHASTPIPESLL